MNTAIFDTDTISNFETVGSGEIAAITGGIGGVPPPRSNDAGGKWLRTLKSNLIDTGLREHATVSDLKQHHWVSAAKDGAAAVVNDFKTIGDAINPFKIF
jgi:hypothetical protein